MMRGIVGHAVALGLALGLSAGAPPMALRAQGYRITGTTLAYYFELQPVLSDSLPDSLATGTGLVRQSPIGTVGCPDGHTQCYFYRSEKLTHTVPLTQDLEVTGWGLGQGVSVYAHVRLRAHLLGESELWTRENDAFTALAAYGELVRERWTARAGRLWLTSQLGVNNFDGAWLAWRPRQALAVEGYAGRALIQGLSESFTSSELGAVDLLPPDVGAILLGVTARYRTTKGVRLGAEYQRELRNDRAGLYSERVALDAAGSVGGASIMGELQADLASSALNEVRIRASRPVAPGTNAAIEYVHSTPFFPLWTIWGVFAPVGFDEARADASWTSAGRGVSLTMSGAFRQYQDTHTGVGFLPLRNDGWTAVLRGAWRLQPGWELTGSYRRDIGFGASKSDGNAGVRWQRADGDGWLALTGSAVQNIFEWVLANGYVVGASVDGGWQLRPDVRVSGQVGLYRHIAEDTQSTTVNWSQRRALLRLVWTTGRDPGMKP
jgi:hypothetical protein